MPPPGSIVVPVIAILACGTLGALAGFALVAALGWSGVLAAIVAAVVGMAVATAAWALGVAAARKLGWLR